MQGKYQANVRASGREVIYGLLLSLALYKLMLVYQVPIQRWQIMIGTKYLGPGGMFSAYVLWGVAGFYLWMLLGKYAVKFVHVLLCGHTRLSQQTRLLEVWVQAPFPSIDAEEEAAATRAARSLRRRLRMVRRYLKCFLKTAVRDAHR